MDGKTRLEKLPGCVKLSPACHGLNKHQHHKKMIFTAALNRKNKQRGMLRDLGLSETVQRNSIIHAALHQSVMRTALRNPESEEQVYVYVPDRFYSDALVEAIGGAWVGDADGEHKEQFYRPRSGMRSSKTRVEAEREKSRL